METPEYPNAATDITEALIKIYLNSFPCHPNCLNLSANKGNSATNKYAATTGNTNTKISFEKMALNPTESYCITNGTLAINIALAGVGTPINESLWRVSILNLANRNAENTGMSNQIY